MAQRCEPKDLGRRATKSVPQPRHRSSDRPIARVEHREILQDLSPLKSVGLHKLKGDRKGQWAMTLNGPWRICFEFRKGDAFEVEIVDYHRG